MNKGEFIKAVQAQTNQSEAETRRVVDAVLDVLTETMKAGQDVTLIGFGTFEVRERAARTGKNPQTGEQIQIAASRVPAFKPGKALKQAINSN